ncbi:MAG: hypothetical protein F3740_07535 [Nitrospinae bacterium]|nr:hypothetical protein [Nitrospinota bacterium]
MKNRVRLFVVVVLCIFFTGCAAGTVYVAQSNDNQASCSLLEKELEKTQNKIKKLETTDHDAKNLRDAALTAAGFAFPPIGVLNLILTVSDSHVADLAETKALEDRYNHMVFLSNQKECGYQYAQRQ